MGCASSRDLNGALDGDASALNAASAGPDLRDDLPGPDKPPLSSLDVWHHHIPVIIIFESVDLFYCWFAQQRSWAPHYVDFTQTKAGFLQDRIGDEQQHDRSVVQDHDHWASARREGNPEMACMEQIQHFIDHPNSKLVLPLVCPSQSSTAEDAVQAPSERSIPELGHPGIDTQVETQPAMLAQTSRSSPSLQILEDRNEVVNIAPEDVAQTEDTAWARLEERILAEVGLADNSQDVTLPLGNMPDMDEILVFEDEGDELKFLDQDASASRAHPHRGRIPKLHARDGQWATGAFAQPGALMAGTSNTLTSSYLDMHHDDDSTQGNVCSMGEECDMDIDDVDELVADVDHEMFEKI